MSKKSVMMNFRNNFYLLFSLLFASFPAFAQNTYLIPPVQLTALKKTEANDYGLIEAQKNDILNENIWKNATYPSTADKFARLPVRLPPEAENLRLKLLLLTATPPQGTTGQAFITLKLNLLFNHGQFDDVFHLVQKIPENLRSKEQNKIYTDILLLQDLQTACFVSQKETENIFQQQLSAVCAALNQEEDKAYLFLDLLKEQNVQDEFIIKAVEHFLYATPLDVFPSEVTPLSVAVWRKSKRSLEDLKEKTNAIWFDTVFAQDENIPVEQRLSTAEQLVENGMLAPSKLRTYYQQVSFDEKVIPNWLPEPKKRAFFLQKAAALTSTPADNLKKQNFLKQGLASAKKSGLTYAFSSAAKDVLQTLKPDTDTLQKSTDIIEAFALAGLDEQAQDWQDKSEIVFPKSHTAANGWLFRELTLLDKNDHVFIPSMERMMAYAEKNKTTDPNFSLKLDRLMLVFKVLGMIHPDENWHYSSFEQGSFESIYANRQDNPSFNKKESIGNSVLDALQTLNGSYTGLLSALNILCGLGLQKEAQTIALQSVDIILNPEKDNE